MRTVILFGLFTIAYAIKPNVLGEGNDQSIFLILVFFSVIMDIADFIKNMIKRR